VEGARDPRRARDPSAGALGRPGNLACERIRCGGGFAPRKWLRRREEWRARSTNRSSEQDLALAAAGASGAVGLGKEEEAACPREKWFAGGRGGEGRGWRGE
jgi:hypothetical protein